MSEMKFEKDIKDKFDQREIIPSAKVWEVLEQDLGKNSSRRNSKYLKLGIAVSILLFLIPSIYIYLHKPITSKYVYQSDPIKPITPNRLNESEIKLNNRKEEVVILDEKNKIDKKVILVKQSSLKKESNKKTRIKNEKQKSDKKIADPLPIIDKKINDVVSQITQLQQTKSEVTNREIDSLLEIAQREIFLENQISTASIDPDSLLQEVEEELDINFREKVLAMLKTKLPKFKVALRVTKE